MNEDLNSSKSGHQNEFVEINVLSETEDIQGPVDEEIIQNDSGLLQTEVPSSPHRKRSTNSVTNRPRLLSNRLAKNPSYEKAMSIPHDTSVYPPDPNDAWLQEVKREKYPNKVDWTTSAVNGRHIWVDTDSSGCHSNSDCKKSGPRKKCCACRIVVHQKCIDQVEQMESCKCRPTFREASPQGGVQPFPTHHVVNRKRQEGKCDYCGKAFQSMLSFQSGKDTVAVSCSWCKKAFHNKSECSRDLYHEKECHLGDHDSLIVPPSWIIKLPARKYSHAGSLNKKQRRVSRRRSSRERRAFVMKPIELPPKTPLIVFVNPKSGGNQGLRIFQKFQWLLNPRQVFDLSNGGPRFGIDLYRKVPNLRILGCGGDGTVGWILSELDRFKVTPSPPVGILPLGTGNDLSRFLGWGGGYTDEPLAKILSHLQEADVEKLDRWDIDVRSNTEAQPSDLEEGCNKLPLTVMNCYFSLGADADVSLEFHESRQANPERFNSRLKNLMFYGKAGGKKVLQQPRNKELHKCIDKLLCDGTDLTDKIREIKPTSILFLNISKFAAGTSPWGHPGGSTFLPQSCDDGYIEVMCLTTTSMVATQVGGHGVRIFQCKQAILVTNKAISMQVDGEPCRLKPSKIHLKQRNQVNMLFKSKHYKSNYQHGHGNYEVEAQSESVAMKLYYITFHQYDRLVQYDTAEIQAIAEQFATISIHQDCQLDELRLKVQHLRLEDEKVRLKLSDNFCFLDATWTARVYRIDESQEAYIHVADIIQDGIFILDLAKPESLSTPQLPASRSQPNTPPKLRRPLSIPVDSLTDQLSLPLDQLQLDGSDQEGGNLLSSIDSEDYSDISEEDTSPETGSPEDLTRQLSPIGKPRSFSNLEDLDIPECEEERNKMFLESAKKGLLPELLFLRSNGVSWTICDARGYTALHFAAKYGHKDVVKYIIDQVPRAVLDLVDNGKGQTPLHKAAYYQRRTICRMLVAAGASLTRLDLEGNSPRLMALLAADEELAKFLENQERLQIIAADDHETPV